MIKKILVSQPKPASDKSPYYDIAERFNVELVFRPFIKVEGLTAKEFRQQRISILEHTAIVFTSRHAIDNFFGLAKEMRLTIPEDMKYKNEQYLVPMSDVHNDSVKEMLDAKKLNHTECVMYRTISNDFTPEEVATFDYDMLVFFSPSGIESLIKNFPDFKQDKVAIATFGPSTAKAAKEAGLRVDLEAPQEKYPSMTGALLHYLTEHQG